MAHQSITRFECDGCKRKHDIKQHDDGKLKPPDSWRWIEIDMYRAPDRDALVLGLVCSPQCAQTVVARAWRPDVAPEGDPS